MYFGVGKIPSQAGTTTRNVWIMVEESKRWVDGDFYQTRILYSRSIISFGLPLQSTCCLNTLSDKMLINFCFRVHVAPTFPHDAREHTEVGRTTSQLWKMGPCEELVSVACSLCLTVLYSGVSFLLVSSFSRLPFASSGLSVGDKASNFKPMQNTDDLFLERSLQILLHEMLCRFLHRRKSKSSKSSTGSR